MQWLIAMWILGAPAWARATAVDSLLLYYDVTHYQMGDVWGRERVDPSAFVQEDPKVARALMAAGRYRRATAFYLGKFAGQHIMATNHHVQETLRCNGAAVWFPVLDETVPCSRVYGSWTDVDLALFAVQLRPEQEAIFAGVGRNFAFGASFYPGQKLLTAGFGIAGNPRQELSLERDDDCMVFSGRDDFQFMADPDAFNPGPYRAWSFAHGCDISHGDSGSPMIDRTDGAVLGLLWTGTIPKAERVQHSSYLQSLLQAQSLEVWQELGYAVPAPMIGRHLQAVLQGATSTSLDAEARAVLQAVLDGGVS